jgi:hypothetical protein
LLSAALDPLQGDAMRAWSRLFFTPIWIHPYSTWGGGLGLVSKVEMHFAESMAYGDDKQETRCLSVVYREPKGVPVLAVKKAEYVIEKIRIFRVTATSVAVHVVFQLIIEPAKDGEKGFTGSGEDFPESLTYRRHYFDIGYLDRSNPSGSLVVGVASQAPD